MKITYDKQANASYIYFTVIGVGGISETLAYCDLAVDLDANDQILAIRLFESEEFKFQNRTKYLIQHAEVKYRETERDIQIRFARHAEVERTVSWDGNVDLDRNNQIVGLEILFAPSDYAPNDGQERLSAEGKLKHLSKYLVAFDGLLIAREQALAVDGAIACFSSNLLPSA
jgi:uncharacterized protein YuzE